MREHADAEALSLDGQWQIAVGGQSGSLTVPGVWERQGYAFGPDQATLHRDFVVPAAWRGAQMWLQFGAVSYAVEVVLNGVPVGVHEGLWTPFEFDVTDCVRCGDTNRLELRIVKPGLEGQTYPYREVLGGFLPYTAMPFGGPWQPVRLLALRGPALVVESVRADWHSGCITIAAHADGAGAGETRLRAEVFDASGVQVAAGAPRAAGAPFDLALAHPAPWSPGHPALYTVRLTLERAGSAVARAERRVGFRALEAHGERLRLNGAPFSLRGALSWGWDPETLAPAPTDEAIRDEFRRARLMGFNLIKLCLFVPPPRLFELANEEGMLLWLELPLWWQRMTPRLRHQVHVEYADILRAVHTHPSVVLYSMGCELDAAMADNALLSELTDRARAATCGALICDNSGSGEAYAGLGADYADFADYHFYCDLHYFTPLLDHFRRDWRRPRPWIFGEFCDSDTYRDPALLDRDGRPWWRDLYGIEGNPGRWAYPEQTERMAAAALSFSGPDLVSISARQSLAIRKTILERARARRDVGGYVLTLLRDTPITTSGVFDDFGQPKFAPEAFRRFNADSVLLLEQGRSRRWTHGGDRPAPRDLHNHLSGAPASFRFILSQIAADPCPALSWRLISDDGHEAAAGTLPIRAWPAPGEPAEIASLDLDLPAVTVPAAFTLEAAVEGVASNQWPIWVYPDVELSIPGVMAHDPAGQFGGRWPVWSRGTDAPALLMAGVYDESVEAYVRAGGRAIVLQPRGGSLPAKPLTFWREAINLLHDHPVFSRFPHAGHTDLQFYHLAADHALDLAALAGWSPVPILQRLDARLFTVTAYLAELRMGSGRLLASTLRFLDGEGDQSRNLDDKPSARFLLHEMMASLLNDAAQP